MVSTCISMIPVHAYWTELRNLDHFNRLLLASQFMDEETPRVLATWKIFFFSTKAEHTFSHGSSGINGAASNCPRGSGAQSCHSLRMLWECDYCC